MWRANRQYYAKIVMNIAQSTQFSREILLISTIVRDKAVTGCYGSSRHERGACHADVVNGCSWSIEQLPLP
jgi:hypothetical protein